eukprot:4773489-Prymnesium_polylepis.2
MICVPSGGGEKYERAYLDYSAFISSDAGSHLPHVRCAFVKPEDANKYRCRYVDLILVELPRRRDIRLLKIIARVGDARFWILAFARQLRLYAERRAEAAAASATFFKRCFMLDEDVIHLHKLSPCLASRLGARRHAVHAPRNAVEHLSQATSAEISGGASTADRFPLPADAGHAAQGGVDHRPRPRNAARHGSQCVDRRGHPAVPPVR